MAELQEETESDFCLLPSLAQLPPHFASFLRDNQVPEDAYNLTVIYRFLRYVFVPLIRSQCSEKCLFPYANLNPFPLDL